MDNKWKVFFLVGTSIFMSTLDSSIVNVALPFMMQDLKSDIQTIQWVVLSYLLTVSSLLLTFGRLSDVKGRKVVYVAGFGLFTAGSLFCGLAEAPLTLILARSIQGVGASMLMACSPALIVDVFPAAERGRALGMMGAVVAAGLTAGPVAGGIILEVLSWRYIFFINLPIGIAAVTGGMALLSGNATARGSREPMDISGSVIFVLFLSSLILLLTKLPEWGWGSARAFFTGGVSLAAGVGFVMNEKQTRFPLFDMQLLSIRLFVFPILSSAILFAALFMIIFMMPFFLTYACGYPASTVGGIMIVPFLFLLVVSPVSGMMYDRFASRRLCMVGMALLAASLVSLVWLQPGDGKWPILWRIALAGLGTAVFVSPNNTATMSSVPLERRGIASGAVATARNMGMVLGVALAGLVFTFSFSGLSGGAILEGYQQAMVPFFMISFKRVMIMGAVLASVGLFITWARGKEQVVPDKVRGT